MSGLTINGGTHNVVFVATLNNSLYAFDADTGAQYWQVNFGTPTPPNAEGCNNVTGMNQVGIVSTPVIDPSSNTLYVTAKTFNTTTHVATFYLHAIDVTSGLEKFAAPTAISATVGSQTFTGLPYLQRMGLLLLNGTIYIGFGSNGCDLNARGWLFAYSASTLQYEAAWVSQPDNSYGSSLWQGGVAPASDGSNIYLSTANGYFSSSTFDYGDSVLKLSMSSGAFSVNDFFTPFDQATLAANDTDLGSGGITLLPYQTGSTTPNLMVTSGKDADIYLISTTGLGGYNPTGNTQIVQYLPGALGGEFFGNPLYWNNTVYFLAHQDYLRAYTLSVNGSGNSVLTASAQTTSKLTTTAFPVISANGTSNGIVWLVRNVAGSALLSAYDATRLFLLYDSGQVAGRDTLGTVTHLATPIVANGKVYVGTQTQLVNYGLFPEILVNCGNNQTGNAGSTLASPLCVVATDPYSGTPLAGVTVTFSDGGKGGTFGSPTATTDSSGKASTTYTLPTKPQTLTITATSPGYSVATFTEQDVVGPVATLGFVSGTKQIGTVGTTLPNPLMVKAKDAVGNVVPGVSVTFTDNSIPTGSFSPNPAVTASNGVASTSYTLPTVAKNITVTASAGSITAKASEQSVPGPATKMTIVQGNNQTAHINTTLSKSLVVSVTDQYGNGISGLTVTFTDNNAGGTFSNPNAVTNNVGQASTNYTTPGQTGTVTINATYSTLSQVFTETVN
jgi:outer membrane protein assembly factor BamB